MLKLRLNLFASYLSVVIQAVSMLIITRVAVNYFGTEKYGLFALVTSLFAYLTLANFGIPWAAATMHAQLKSKLEKLRLAKIAFGLTVILSILFLLIVLVVSLFSPKWIDILGEIPTEIFPLAFWFVLINLIGFIIYIPFTVFSQILIFSNLSYQVKIVDAIRYIGNVVALLLVSFIGLTMVDYAVVTVFLMLLAGAAYFYYLRRNYRNLTVEHVMEGAENNAHVSARNVLTKGGYFWLNGLAGVIIMNTDAIVISHILGLNMVAKYSIIATFLTLALVVVAQLMNVINPLYPQLLTQNPINKSAKQKLELISNAIVMSLGFIALLFAVIIPIFSEKILTIWLANDGLYAGNLTSLALSLYFGMLMISLVPYSIMAAMGEARSLFKLTLLEATLNLVLSIILVLHVGIAGVFIGSAIANGATTLVWCSYYVNRKYKSHLKINIRQTLSLILLLLSVLLLSFIGQHWINDMFYKIIFAGAVIVCITIVIYICYAKKYIKLYQMRNVNYEGC